MPRTVAVWSWSLTMILFCTCGCRPAKDARSRAPEARKGTPKRETGPEPPSMTAIAELGVPLFALRIDLAALGRSPLVKSSGLPEMMQKWMSRHRDEFSEEMETCLGVDLVLPTDFLDGVTVFGANSQNLVILFDTVMSASKFMECMAKVNPPKDGQLRRHNFGKVAGYRGVDEKGKVSYVVPVAERRLLWITGEQKELVARIRVGEGDLGTGATDGYFGSGRMLVVIGRDFPLGWLNKGEAKFQIPNLTSGNLSAWLDLSDKIELKLDLDAKDPTAAESMAAFLVVMKGLPMVHQTLKEFGFAENLIADAVRVVSVDSEVRVRVVLGAADSTRVVAVLNTIAARKGTQAPGGEDAEQE